MNTLDLPGLESLRPEDVQQYLLHSGWQKSPPHYSGSMNYARPVARNRKVTAQVVLNRSFADYKRRMAEVVDVLAAVEQRSPLEVLGDLLLPPSDAIHCRIHSEVAEAGLIPLEDSIRIRQAQKQLLLSCAHSELDSRTHFPRLSQTEAVELLRSCREGPTTRGSYMTTLIVPVEPAVGPDSPDPYSRRVTRRLMAALSETSTLVEAQDTESLLSRADHGVSANFLAALAELRPPGAQSYVEIDIAWSRARPAAEVKRSKVRFSEGVFGVLAEAARALRDQTPAPGTEIEGFVVRLSRDRGTNKPGVVVVATQLPDRPGTSMVHINLEEDDYSAAVDAHKHGLRVTVIGTLKAEPRTLRLLKPTGWQVLGRDPLGPAVEPMVK